MFPFLVFQSVFVQARSECARYLSVVILIACLACGCSVSVFLSKVLNSLFGMYKKSVIAGPSLPKKSKVAGRILQYLSFNSLMMWSRGGPGWLGPLIFFVFGCFMVLKDLIGH